MSYPRIVLLDVSGVFLLCLILLEPPVIFVVFGVIIIYTVMTHKTMVDVVGGFDGIRDTGFTRIRGGTFLSFQTFCEEGLFGRGRAERPDGSD